MGFPRFNFFQIVIRAQKSRPKSWSMPRKPSLFRGTREALFFFQSTSWSWCQKKMTGWWFVNPFGNGTNTNHNNCYDWGMVYDCFTHSIQIYSWLVVWNIFSIYWECHHPNWRSPSFFRGVGQPPTRWCRIGVFHVFFSAPTLSAIWRPRSKTPRASCFRGNLMPSNW